MFTRIPSYLTEEVPIAPLALLRVLFGLLMIGSTTRFVLLGWVDDQYVAPIMHFPYEGFTWVTSLGAPGMYIVFAAMLLAAVGVMLGAWYRVASVVLFFTFTYVELIDKSYYLNHYYFVSIVSALFCVVPAHRAWSVDARRRPALAATHVPRWTIDIFKIQLGIVYFFAGIAKINHDWLLEALPMKIWMPANDTKPMIGWLMRIPWMPYVFSWCGMLYDTTIPFFLLWRRTRVVAYVAVIVFHVLTAIMFPAIGVFPAVMIGMTLVFFDAPFHQRILRGIDRLLPTAWRWKVDERIVRHVKGERVIVIVLAAHVVVQLLLPFRYLLYPGNLYWGEEGYRFSWRVMLMEKAGTATFYVRDGDTGREGVVVNGEFLNAHQEKQMSMQPDMVLQFAHHLAQTYRGRGMADPKVRAEVWVTLNGRASRLLVDPQCDLAAEPVGLHHYAWINHP